MSNKTVYDKTLMERINQGRQYRNMVLETRAKEEGAEDPYIVEGYATTFNDPYILYEDSEIRIFEQVDSKAFDNCNMEDVIFQYDHKGRVYARGSNNTLEVTPDEHGLHVVANLGGTEEGRKLHEEIKGGYSTKMSFGFLVTDEKVEKRKADDGKEEYLRTITVIGKLFDVSAVSLPANDGTEISARSFIDELKEARSVEITEQQKEEEERKRKELEEQMRQKERERERLALELEISLTI